MEEKQWDNFPGSKPKKVQKGTRNVTFLNKIIIEICFDL